MKGRCALALAALAFSFSPFACGGSTTSPPPGPQPLEVDAGSAENDASKTEDEEPSGSSPDAGDADDADVALTECPGFVEPDEFASCSQNAMNNQCNVNCHSGSRNWQSQCRDGVCSCAMGFEVKCTCTMEPGVCRSCCPGMARN